VATGRAKCPVGLIVSEPVLRCSRGGKEDSVAFRFVRVTSADQRIVTSPSSSPAPLRRLNFSLAWRRELNCLAAVLQYVVAERQRESAAMQEQLQRRIALGRGCVTPSREEFHHVPVVAGPFRHTPRKLIGLPGVAHLASGEVAVRIVPSTA
jgi:hypothetical protein